MSEPIVGRPIVERCYIDLKPGEGHFYVELWPEFEEILMSLPGAVAARLLRSQTKPDSFVCCMEWVSKEAKDTFIADPRLKPWAERFWPHVANEVIEYYDDAV